MHVSTSKVPARELASLFEPRRHAALYPSLTAELDAVARGRKAIAMEAWPAGALDADHRAMHELARARGLEVVELRERGRAGTPAVLVFAFQPEHAWRIAALQALWSVYLDAEGAWSDGAEALEGHLLGYTRAQIARHLAARRHERLGWRGATLYLMLDRAQRAVVVASRGRALPAGALTLVTCDGTHVIRRRPPAWVARRALAIARIAIVAEAAGRLLPERHGWLRRGSIEASELTRLLEAPAEVLTARGWR
jgi:hypothetical protein